MSWKTILKNEKLEQQGELINHLTNLIGEELESLGDNLSEEELRAKIEREPLTVELRRDYSNRYYTRRDWEITIEAGEGDEFDVVFKFPSDRKIGIGIYDLHNGFQPDSQGMRAIPIKTVMLLIGGKRIGKNPMGDVADYV